MSAPVLELDAVSKRFERRLQIGERIAARLGAGPARQVVHAVDGVSLTIAARETLALVGESGCGKSTLGRMLLRLIDPTSGTVSFMGEDLTRLDESEMRARRRHMQIVFQDPYASLNPRMTVADILGEPLMLHAVVPPAGRAARIAELLSLVGLRPEHARRYPHEFSGGQRQRIGIARALALGPDLVFADEPVSALDVSVQAQILVLMERLKAQRELAFVFISHDLGVVRHFCRRVVVLYLGRVVESGPVPGIFEEPLHPYTQLLKASSPVPDPAAAVAMAFQEGEPPSPVDPPPGCHFHPRCPRVMPVCRSLAPALQTVAEGRSVACHLYGAPA